MSNSSPPPPIVSPPHADAQVIPSKNAIDARVPEDGQRKRLPPWLISSILHLIVFVAIGLALRPISKGVEGGSDRSGSLVVVSRTKAQTEYLSESDMSDATANASSNASPATVDAAFPNSSESPLEHAGLFPTNDGLIGPSGGQPSVIPDAGELLNGLGSGGQVGEDTSTQVFGTQGTGSKFVYVFDRSSSMEGYDARPRKEAQKELAASLAVLESTHQFQIVFYNESPSVFNPNPNRPAQLMFGTEENLEAAQRFIQAIEGRGSTRHMEPLRLALGMAPDVIFFLTDAQEPILTESDLAEIRRLNRAGTSINTIEFGSGPQRNSNNFLVKLARQHNGQHVYIDVTKLP